MKALRTVLAMSALAASLLVGLVSTGCEGPEGPPGVVNRVVVNISITTPEWRWDSQLRHYYVYVDMPELNSYNTVEGVLLSYFVWPDGNKEVQDNIPYTQDFGPYSRRLECNYSVGQMMIVARNSDLSDRGAPENMRFRFKAMW